MNAPSTFWHPATGHHLIACDGGPRCRGCVAQFVRRCADGGAAIILQSPAGEIREIAALMGGLPPDRRLSLLPPDAPADELLTQAQTACRHHGHAVVYRHSAAGAPGHRLHLEQQLGLLCRDSRLSALCHEERPDGLSTAELVAVHGGNVSDGCLFQATRRDGSLHLSGEIDASNEALLRQLLAAAAATGDGSLDLDLAGLSFISSAAVGALVAETASFREFGGRVVLHEPTPLISTVLQTLGVSKAANMFVRPR